MPYFWFSPIDSCSLHIDSSSHPPYYFSELQIISQQVSQKRLKLKVIVKLRSRSRSGEGQVRVRRVRFGPELYPIFGFHPQTPAPCIQTPAPTQTSANSSCSLNKDSSSQIHSRFSLHLPSSSLIQTPSSASPAPYVSLYSAPPLASPPSCPSLKIDSLKVDSNSHIS